MFNRRTLTTLLLAFALSLLIVVLAAGRGSLATLAIAAGLFGVQVVLVLLRFNIPLWRAPQYTAGQDWAWDNTMLTALVYAWGAAAMFTIYSQTPLYWRHWWQYGLGMALLGVAAVLSALYLARRNGPVERAKALRLLIAMSVAQLIAVVTALIYLVASGALATIKDDWAANPVFIVGGLTVAAISLVSLYTHRLINAPVASAA
jgi:hypothetical protein